MPADMGIDADTTVRRFISALAAADEPAALALAAPEMVFHNVPLAGPLEAAPAIAYHCRLFRRYTRAVRWDISWQVAHGSRVMHERVDTTHYINGETSLLPIAGVFEVRDGQITLWRDYWDTGTLKAQLGADWQTFYQRLKSAAPVEQANR